MVNVVRGSMVNIAPAWLITLCRNLWWASFNEIVLAETTACIFFYMLLNSIESSKIELVAPLHARPSAVMVTL